MPFDVGGVGDTGAAEPSEPRCATWTACDCVCPRRGERRPGSYRRKNTWAWRPRAQSLGRAYNQPARKSAVRSGGRERAEICGVEEYPSHEELEALGLYDPTSPDAAEQLRLLMDALDLGATLEELKRAAGVRYNLSPLMLDLAMRPAGDTQDLADFVASRADAELMRRMWSAFGLPDSKSPLVRVTPDAADALRFMAVMASTFGEQAAFGLARVIGSTMARLAGTISGTFRVGQEIPQLSTGTSRSEYAESLTDIVRDGLPFFLEAVGAVFRRHLVNVSYQTWSTDPDQSVVVMERTVCFADLVRSTEVLRAVSIREMANMLRRFEEQIWDLVSAHGGQVVKLIGDEAMFIFEEPSEACLGGLDLIERSEHPVRVGMAHGTVANLYGDFYGETVNLAARIVQQTHPSTLVVSEDVRNRAGRVVTFQALEPLLLRGFAEPVLVFQADRTSNGFGSI
jgi:class 3 adenylate cyclase